MLRQVSLSQELTEQSWPASERKYEIAKTLSNCTGFAVINGTLFGSKRRIGLNFILIIVTKIMTVLKTKNNDHAEDFQCFCVLNICSFYYFPLLLSAATLLG